MAIQAIHKYFYPRSPCGERHIHDFSALYNILISIHALLAESDRLGAVHDAQINISIHALLAESDKPKALKSRRCVISIHALLAESDTSSVRESLSGSTFLSTLSLRRATAPPYNLIIHHGKISIHALLAESDISFSAGRESDTAFLSTLSLRRATGNIINSNCNLTHFYPRSPCGERLIPVMVRLTAQLFLSTLSLRRATVNGGDLLNSFGISIHALLAESDEVSNLDRWLAGLFLSTLSLRRATQHSEPDSGGMRFLSTLSLRRATVVGR